MTTNSQLFLNEKIGLTVRERSFAVSVISKAVLELKAYQRREERTGEFADELYKDMPCQRERSIGYGYGKVYN